MDKKVCNKCKEEKPLDDFYNNRSCKDGKHQTCRVCSSNYLKERYKERCKENPDRMKKIQKRNRENTNKKFEILKNSSELITKICSKCNKEKIITNFNAQYSFCKECSKIKQQKYYLNNSERIKNRVNDYRKSNPEKNTERKRITKQRRKKKDPVYRAMYNLRGRLTSYIKLNSLVKQNNFAKIIGITPEGFREYIESQFEEGMTWDNRGIYTWHLDHIIPISTAKTIEDVERLTHYTNFQPLWSEVNRSKGDKILPEFEHLIEERLGDIRVPPNPNSLRSI